MNTTAFSTTLDVREIAPRDRHALIFGTLDRLNVGERLLIVNDHDPKPLYYQLQAEAAGEYGWSYLAQGPEVWRVAIERIATGRGTATCACHCGGH